MLEQRVDKRARTNLKDRNRQSRQREECEASTVPLAERRLRAGEWQRTRNMEKERRDFRSWRAKDL